MDKMSNGSIVSHTVYDGDGKAKPTRSVGKNSDAS